jgi:signal transduction histidine kinase
MPLAVLLLLLIVLFAALAFVQMRKQQEVMRLRESFISSVSHELRTPLQQILVFSELLRMDKLPAGERQQAIEVVERETRRLIRMVENVLRFSRPTRGKDSLIIESVPLEPLVQDVIKVFEPWARKHDMRVRLHVEQPVVALADASALRGVLLNLLDNAMKYGPAGQTVSVELSARDHTAILAVEDEGPGVPRAQRAQVWEPFQRLERDQRAAITGSGIGLSIVRELVERMNGTVRIEDARGSSGARFIVELPGR